MKNLVKIGVRIIHGRVLYMGAYYTRVNTVSRVSTRQIKERLWGDICEFCKLSIERRFTDNISQSSLKRKPMLRSKKVSFLRNQLK